MRQVANEADEAPAFSLAGFLTRTPGRHAGQADAILNDVKQLMVLETLRRCQSHVRGPRVQTATLSVSPLPSLAVRHWVWRMPACHPMARFRTVRAMKVSRPLGSSVFASASPVGRLDDGVHRKRPRQQRPACTTHNVSGQGIDHLGQRHVLVGEAAGIARREHDLDIAVDVRPFGMVIGLLGGQCHATQFMKPQASLKSANFRAALDGVAARDFLPLWQGRDGLGTVRGR